MNPSLPCHLIDLLIDPTGPDLLTYQVVQFLGSTSVNGFLYQLDRQTGHATEIGLIGSFPGQFQRVGGMAFNPVNNVLYGCFGGQSTTGGLVTIDTSTGQGTLQVSTQPFTDLAIQPETGVLYGIDNGGGQLPNSLYTVDVTSGSVTLIGTTGHINDLGLEFVAVPEPSTFVLAAIGLVAALLSLRRA